MNVIYFFVMFKIGKYLSAISHGKIMKNLSRKDEETALLQGIIDYILISYIVSTLTTI